MIECKIINNYPVKVTKSGELVVAPLNYSDAKFNAMNLTTPFNFFGPLPAKQFIITGFSLKASTGVSPVADARVVIYEASSSDSAIEDRIIFEEAMIRGDRTGYVTTNILVNPGKWINASTTDTTIFATILGYYITEL